MVLGAGIYQVPLIKKAKAMGMEVIVASIPGKYPGISLADKFFPIDTRDNIKILEIAQKESINGICTSGTDIAVRSIGVVNSKMGLAGIQEKAAYAATDKAIMKEAFIRGNVSTAVYEKACTKEEVLGAGEKIGYPVIVKAVDSSGSKGICKASDEIELLHAYEEALLISKKEYVLIEEFIDAVEIGVDAYIGEEHVEAFYPHDKFNYKINERVIPIGHKFPYKASEDLLKELRRQIELAARALGIRNCPLNADVFIKGNKVWVIEIGGRSGATCIPELISLYGGFDWYEKIIQAAMGEKVVFPEEGKCPCMAKLIFSPVSGILKRVDWKEIERLKYEGVLCQLDFKVGEKICSMENGTNRLGHIIVKTHKETVLDNYVSRIRRCVCMDKGNLEALWEK